MNISSKDFGCTKSCTGLYADVLHTKTSEVLSNEHLGRIIEDYQRYKYNYARNIVFDGDMKTNGENYISFWAAI